MIYLFDRVFKSCHYLFQFEAFDSQNSKTEIKNELEKANYRLQIYKATLNVNKTKH